MKKIIRRAAAICMAVIILASGCGSGSEPVAVPDESTVEIIEKIQIEIEYDGDEVLGDAIRKAADGFNESQDIYVASVGNTGTDLQELVGDPQSAESLTDEASEIENAENQQDEVSGTENTEDQQDEASRTENAEGLPGDSGQRVESLTASVVFTDDNMAFTS